MTTASEKQAEKMSETIIRALWELAIDSAATVDDPADPQLAVYVTRAASQIGLAILDSKQR